MPEPQVDHTKMEGQPVELPLEAPAPGWAANLAETCGHWWYPIQPLECLVSRYSRSRPPGSHFRGERGPDDGEKVQPEDSGVHRDDDPDAAEGLPERVEHTEGHGAVPSPPALARMPQSWSAEFNKSFRRSSDIPSSKSG